MTGLDEHTEDQEIVVIYGKPCPKCGFHMNDYYYHDGRPGKHVKCTICGLGPIRAIEQSP